MCRRFLPSVEMTTAGFCHLSTVSMDVMGDATTALKLPVGTPALPAMALPGIMRAEYFIALAPPFSITIKKTVTLWRTARQWRALPVSIVRAPFQARSCWRRPGDRAWKGAYTNTDLNTGRAKRSLRDLVAAPGLWINRVAAGKISSFTVDQGAGRVSARRFRARRRQEQKAQLCESRKRNSAAAGAARPSRNQMKCCEHPYKDRP